MRASDSKLRSSVLDGCPMFAPAYMGRKRVLRMLSLHVHGLLLLTAVCAVSESVGRAAPRHLRPMYAWANMGHPSREEGFVPCFTSATPSNSSKLATPISRYGLKPVPTLLRGATAAEGPSRHARRCRH